jgi:RNA polymerase sigma-32 factor
MAELRRYPLLTLEEERRLAVEAYEKNSVEARQRLVTANLRLVVKIAMDYRRAYAQMLDLIQEGNAGLVQAVNRFNPYRGVKLSTYSAWWIRAYILKFLMDNKSLVRIGTTDAQRKLFFRLRAEAEKMYALTQRFDARLLAEKIGVKESDVVEMNQRLSKGDLSLDAPVFDDSHGTRQVDLMEDEREGVDEKIAREEILEILREEAAAIEKELNERDLYIFRNRILADDPITLQDVGDKFGITRERARQLESRVLKKIRERLEDAGIDVP